MVIPTLGLSRWTRHHGNEILQLDELTLPQSPVSTTTDFEYSLSLATSNRFGQARSLGASAPRGLSFALSGILINIV
jgi:hypothetical protein